MLFRTGVSRQKFGIRQLLCGVARHCLAMSNLSTRSGLADLFCIPALEPPCCGSAYHIHTAVTVVDISPFTPFSLMSFHPYYSQVSSYLIAFDLGLFLVNQTAVRLAFSYI